MMKKIVYCSLLASVAVLISSLERFVPLNSVIPLPGLKLGLANCIILLTLIKMDFKSAFSVFVCKCFIVALLFSGFSSFIYSFVGGLFSITGMFLLLRFKKFFSLIGVSICGAALFNFGQILASSLMLGSVYVFSYLPLLVISSVFTGAVIGIIADILNRNINFRWF